MKYTQKDAKALHTAAAAIAEAFRQGYYVVNDKGQRHAVLEAQLQAALDALDVTPVIFRKFPNGDVIALFPTLPGDSSPSTCASYMHVGQHGAASVTYGKRHPLATRAEFLPLKKELEGLGYRLKVITKVAASHNRERLAQLSK